MPKNKKAAFRKGKTALILYLEYYHLNLFSSETVSFLRPLLLRAASTRLPLAVSIRERKPCLFTLFLLDG